MCAFRVYTIYFCLSQSWNNIYVQTLIEEFEDPSNCIYLLGTNFAWLKFFFFFWGLETIFSSHRPQSASSLRGIITKLLSFLRTVDSMGDVASHSSLILGIFLKSRVALNHECGPWCYWSLVYLVEDFVKWAWRGFLRSVSILRETFLNFRTVWNFLNFRIVSELFELQNFWNLNIKTFWTLEFFGSSQH